MKAQRVLFEAATDSGTQPEQKKLRAGEAVPEIKYLRVQFMGWLPLLENIEKLDEVVMFLSLNYEREFTVATTFNPTFIRRLTYHGFLPMAGFTYRGPIMTPKLHMERCILCFENLHVPKKVKKKCKHFDISVDQCFTEVVEQCNVQHGKMSWLCEPLVDSFVKIHNSKDEDGDPNANCGRRRQETACRMHSIELWADDELVAGEIGYSVGRCYTSLSGFSNADSSGTIQCVATAKFLEKCGFKFWDLGMELRYKLDLGASTWPRHLFLKELMSVRDQKIANFSLRRTNAKEIIFPGSETVPET